MSGVRAADVPRLEVRRTIHASREAVFRAWITPASVARWFASPGTPVRHVEIEPRPGGRFYIECDYRGAVWRLEGSVRELSPPARLSFHWVSDDIPAAVGSIVTVELTESASGVTEMVLTQDGFPNTKERDGNTEGWNELANHIRDMFADGILS